MGVFKHRSLFSPLLVLALVLCGILDVHAHLCSAGDEDCLAEMHSDALKLDVEHCADKDCVDAEIGIADSAPGKVSADLDLSDVAFLVALSHSMVWVTPTRLFHPEVDTSVRFVAHALPPPARAPPQLF